MVRHGLQIDFSLLFPVFFLFFFIFFLCLCKQGLPQFGPFWSYVLYVHICFDLSYHYVHIMRASQSPWLIYRWARPFCALCENLAGKQTLTSVDTHTYFERDMYLVKCIGTRFHISHARIQWPSAYFVQELQSHISAKPKIKN